MAAMQPLPLLCVHDLRTSLLAYTTITTPILQQIYSLRLSRLSDPSLYLLSTSEVVSAIIPPSTCRTLHLLSLP